MNIRNNITNYLFDKDYIICAYEDNVYVFNYTYLESFSNKRITLKLPKKYVNISGDELTIVQITKEEILIKGKIRRIDLDEK